ncbi:MAG: hypothetical protein E7409_00200 [Ruminococcaceae bacterium]|nr:hypothetical protein [Oscillospiraceae bacterium]
MNINAFLASLPIMLYGMIGVFVVIAVIALVITLLLKIFPEKKENQ